MRMKYYRLQYVQPEGGMTFSDFNTMAEMVAARAALVNKGYRIMGCNIVYAS